MGSLDTLQDPRADRPDVRAVPAPRRAPPPARDHDERRRAADGRDGAGADARSPGAAARRALGRPRAGVRRGDLREDRGRQSRRRDDRDGGAERAPRARDVQPRLRARPRAERFEGPGQGAAGRPQGRRALSRRDGRVDEPEARTKRRDREDEDGRGLGPGRLSNRVAARARDYSGPASPRSRRWAPAHRPTRTRRGRRPPRSDRPCRRGRSARTRRCSRCPRRSAAPRSPVGGPPRCTSSRRGRPRPEAHGHLGPSVDPAATAAR